MRHVHRLIQTPIQNGRRNTMSKISDALTKVTPLPLADVPDETRAGKHLACRICNPTAVAGTVLTGLCGQRYKSEGIASSTYAAWANAACSGCIAGTEIHMNEVHPDLIEPAPEF